MLLKLIKTKNKVANRFYGHSDLFVKVRKKLCFYIPYGEQFFMSRTNFKHVKDDIYEMED